MTILRRPSNGLGSQIEPHPISFRYPLINYLVSTKTAQLFVWPRELSTKLLGKLSLLITDFSNVNRVMTMYARVCNLTIILNLKN